MKSVHVSTNDKSIQVDMKNLENILKTEKQFLFFEYSLFIHSNLIKIIVSIGVKQVIV